MGSRQDLLRLSRRPSQGTEKRLLWVTPQVFFSSASRTLVLHSSKVMKKELACRASSYYFSACFMLSSLRNAALATLGDFSSLHGKQQVFLLSLRGCSSPYVNITPTTQGATEWFLKYSSRSIAFLPFSCILMADACMQSV